MFVNVDQCKTKRMSVAEVGTQELMTETWEYMAVEWQTEAMTGDKSW